MRSSMLFEKTTTGNFDAASRLEWLETNGLGGWASSTVSGAHTRRYHGLLVAALTPPVGRMVLVSKLEESLDCGEVRVELGCNRYPGVVHPPGHLHLKSFRRDLFPVFEYETEHFLLRKTIAAVNGENTTLVLYELLGSSGPVRLSLRPLFAFRDYHSLTRANDSFRREVTFSDSVLGVQMYADTPQVFIRVPGARFHFHADWYRNFQYSLELYRGLDWEEDLLSYGYLERELQPGEHLGVVVSTREPKGSTVHELLAREKARRLLLISQLPVHDEFSETLSLAADQFIVRRDGGEYTVIAGYHWFADWGRDTMVALPGLTLATGRPDVARSILGLFASHVSRGMLPNRFPDDGSEPEYNTVDAALWFFVATYEYWKHTGDRDFISKRLLPVLEEVLNCYREGTRYGIHADTDGLLYSGERGVQLTWMDARVGDRVITPRQGKAVEINALWYNAHCIYARLLRETTAKGPRAKRIERQAAAIATQFVKTFWDPQRQLLFDCVGNGDRDPEIRPNQIFALSLPFPLLSQRRAAGVLRAVEGFLVTPVGLRSLAPDDPAYRGSYGGDPASRDGAYHQGTVWSWLMGPYLTSLSRFSRKNYERKRREIAERFQAHFREACVGSISEIFDGDAPHEPRGAIAQAWSVAEILRAYVESPPAGSRRVKRPASTHRTARVTAGAPGSKGC